MRPSIEGQPERTSQDVLSTQLKLLMLLRVVTVTLLLGVTTYLQSRQKSDLVDLPLILLYALCVFSYVLTILYALAIKKGFNPWHLAYIQLSVDVLFIDALIYITNGHDVFTFLFVLTVVNSSIILRRRGAIFMAFFSTLAYGVLLDLQFLGILPVISGRDLPVSRIDDLVANIFYNGSAYFIVALLSGFLSEELQRVGRKLQEKQVNLEDLENLNRNIVESLSSGLITINSDFLTTSFNRFAEDITGLSFDEVFNQPIENFFPGIQQELEKTNSRWEMKYSRKKDQPVIILGFSCAFLKHQDGRALGRIINFQDVTYLKNMQERMRETDKLAAIGRLAASIAHEIRNPLASMSGSIQMLGEEMDPQGQNRVLMDIVIRETERLNQLIKEFLEFAKPKKSNLTHVDLQEVIRETVAVGRQRILGGKAQSIEIRVQTPAERVIVKADVGKLKQVIWNLLLNAFQAIDGEAGDVSVDLSKSKDNGLLANLEVRDTGRGINSKDLEFIYEPFFTTKPQGTGMGLATVRRIVDESDWQIEVESEVGKGTVFRLRMPIESQDYQPVNERVQRTHE